MSADRCTRRRVGLALFVFLLAVQFLNFSGVPHSSDGLAMLATTESLARRGDLDMNAYRWMGLQQGTFGPDGDLYSRKGLGQTVAALPLAWLGLRAGAIGLLQAALLASPLVAAATGWLLYRCLALLGYSTGASLAAALALSLATPLLPYGKHDFSDPLTGLALLAAFAAWLAFRRRPSLAAALGVGAGLGFAALTRTTSLALTPVFALAIWVGRPNPLAPFPEKEGGGEAPLSPWERGRGRGLPHPLAPFPGKEGGGEAPLSPWERDRGRGLPHILAFSVGLGVFVALSGWFNYLRFGNPLTSGYLAQESFSANLVEGVSGLLISPGRGLFLYAPVLALALFGFRDLTRRHRDVAWGALAIAAAHVLIYGKWFMWHGGYCWGPRFLAPAMPFLALGLASIWERGGHWRSGLPALAAVGFVLNLPGSLVHFAPFQDSLLSTGLPLFDPRTFWAPRFSPLVGQWSHLGLGTLDFAWASAGTVDALSLGALLAGLVLSVMAVRSTLAGHGTILTAVAALAVVGSLAFTLARSHAAGSLPLDGLLATIAQRERAGDVIITTTPGDATLVSDRYRGRLATCSLPDYPHDVADRLAAEYSRFWVLDQGFSSATGDWLAGIGYRALQESAGERRLTLYALAPEAMTASGVHAEFADGITLRETAFAVEGDTVLVRLHWRAKATPSRSYKVFVHALDSSGAVIAQSDAVPAGWTRPTDTWAPGEEVEDRHALLLPAGAPVVALRIGMYALEGGQALPLADGAARVELPLTAQ